MLHTASVVAIIKRNDANNTLEEIIDSTKNPIERDIQKGEIKIVQCTIFVCERIVGVAARDGQ